MSSIYALIGDDGEVRYIGKANCPTARLKSHMEARNRLNTPVYSWIRKHGRPTMIVLEDACEDWEQSERQWIAAARASGAPLLNVTAGGTQPCSEAMHKDPQASRIWSLKKNMAVALSKGYCPPELWGSLFYTSRVAPCMFGKWFERMSDRYLPRWSEKEWDRFTASVEAHCAA